MSNILIVEDETLLSDVYAMVLTAHGHIARVAGNGAEALAIIDDFKPDVVLLDLLMPQMDGISFLKAYNHDPTLPPRIIVYSNLFDSRKEEEVKSLGAVDIVLKSSVTPEGLVSLVASHGA